MDLKQVKAIAFDVDGLLVDTERYYTKSWKMGLEKYGESVTDEEVQQYSGFNWHIVRGLLTEKYNAELAQKVVEEREVILNELIEAGKMEAKPYVYEVLDWCQSHNIRMGIASSGKKARAKRIIEKLGIDRYMEFCIFGDDVEKNKPYPDAYLKAVRNFDLPKEEVIAVEDSLTGAKAATAAGLGVVVIPDVSLHHQPYSAEQLADINVLVQGSDLRAVKDYLEETNAQHA